MSDWWHQSAVTDTTRGAIVSDGPIGARVVSVTADLSLYNNLDAGIGCFRFKCKPGDELTQNEMNFVLSQYSVVPLLALRGNASAVNKDSIEDFDEWDLTALTRSDRGRHKV